MSRGLAAPCLLSALALVACESPDSRPCLLENPRPVALSTRPLVTRHIYTTEQVEIALTPRTFEQMKSAICERSDFFEGCTTLETLEGNPPVKARAESVRDRVIAYMLAAALDLGRATVRERSSGELAPLIVAVAYQDTCGSRHRVGRRYSLPGMSPFLEVRDL